MSGKRYTEEFKVEAVEQVTERGHRASEVAARLGVSAWSLHRWIKEREQPAAERIESQTQSVEIRRFERSHAGRDQGASRLPQRVPRYGDELLPRAGREPCRAKALSPDAQLRRNLSDLCELYAE